MAAYYLAREEGPEIVVEQFAPGADFRLLVVGGKLVAAARREPAVVGDGVRTVAQLVAEVNRDPRRGDGHANVLSKIVLNADRRADLDRAGTRPTPCPPPGETVLVRRNANLSTGGTAVDVTERVHPSSPPSRSTPPG